MLAGTLTQRMDLLVKRGIFESEESLTMSAYRSLLTLQPALKLEIALSLYQGEEISLGRAAEVAGVSREQMKELLAARGIERKYPQRSQEQVDRDVRLLLERQGSAVGECLKPRVPRRHRGIAFSEESKPDADG